MEAGYLESVKNDLVKVDAKLKQHFKLRSGTAGDYAHIELSALDHYLRPALVLLFARLFGQNGEKPVYLASIIQLIFMSAKIHLGIPETTVDSSNEVKELDPRDGTQLPVLVGDYLYGKFFSLLCEAGLLEALKPLADMISEMNEGAITRIQLTSEKPDLEDVIESIGRETAELISGACRLASGLGPASIEEIETAASFGYNLGLGYGLMGHGFNPNIVSQYQNQALADLAKFKDSAPIRALESLTKALFGHDLPKIQWMVG